ncbi:MAG: ABC transporter ATP-binding protein [Patescibacteria group bacterium]|jgi:putative ABC transport system ATP-binding protein
MPEKIIELNKVSKIYRSGDEDFAAISNISLSINKGEFVAIMGPSGSGKSTLMHILGLLDTPTTGTYQLEGEAVDQLSQNKLSKLRNQKIGFVFQQFNLLPRTSVLGNVLLPTIYGNANGSKEKAKKIIKEVGLERRINHKSNQLSGGQIQRVAIARALIMNPSIILADEPTGNLDTKTSTEIMELFKKINEDDATIVLITHEEHIAKFAKRIIRLIDGRIIPEQGK